MTTRVIERDKIRQWFDRRYVEKGVRSMRAFEAYPPLLEYLPIKRGKTLLDVGCGTGFLLKEASRNGLKTYGIDLSREAVKLTRRVSPRVRAVHGSGDQLCFRGDLFDYVTCIGTLEHFQDMEQGLREIGRVARRDATLCFMVPNSDSVIWRISELLGALDNESNENGRSLKSWKRLFSNNGFEIIAVERDRWYIRKILSLRPFRFLKRLEKTLLCLLRSPVPLSLANQLIFLLKRRQHAPQEKSDGVKSEMGQLYDSLARFVLFSNLLRYGARNARLTMHKILQPNGSPGKAESGGSKLTYLEDFALSRLDLPPNPAVLDAGCGFGTTVFRWHEMVEGKYDGMTLSPVQVNVARGEARRLGLDSDCRFYFRDFDDPLPAKYDVIVAIESLIHSRDFRRTIGTLAEKLTPGGYLVVVDDMKRERVEDGTPREWQSLKLYWRLSGIPSVEEYRSAFQENRIRVEEEFDLSDQVEFTREKVVTIMAFLCRLLYAAVPSRGVRSVVSAQLGGFALQRIYRSGGMNYRLLVGRKLPDDWPSV